jgi:hypothetical protein
MIVVRLVDLILISELQDAPPDVQYIVLALNQVLNGVQVINLIEKHLEVLLDYQVLLVLLFVFEKLLLCLVVVFLRLVIALVKREEADTVLHQEVCLLRVYAFLEQHGIVPLGHVGQDLGLLVHVVDVVSQHAHTLLAFLVELALVA